MKKNWDGRIKGNHISCNKKLFQQGIWGAGWFLN